MTREEFQEFWQKNYPETPPTAHAFKHYLPTRWVRIHSLPESKRYADTAAEWKTLLRACWGIVFGRKNKAFLSETRQILQL
jgi:hypothetical protein